LMARFIPKVLHDRNREGEVASHCARPLQLQNDF
jgi:hypothetical protein